MITIDDSWLPCFLLPIALRAELFVYKYFSYLSRLNIWFTFNNDFIKKEKNSLKNYFGDKKNLFVFLFICTIPVHTLDAHKTSVNTVNIILLIRITVKLSWPNSFPFLRQSFCLSFSTIICFSIYISFPISMRLSANIISILI